VRFSSPWPAAKDAGLQWVRARKMREWAPLSRIIRCLIGPLILIAVASRAWVFGRDAVQRPGQPRRMRAF